MTMTGMRSEDEMVAYALETGPALLRYVPELLADLGGIGKRCAGNYQRTG